jgi:predicted transcriptional regulator
MGKRISFRLDAEDEKKLRTMAKQRNTTMTAILKEAIREAGKRSPQGTWHSKAECVGSLLD